MTTQQLVLSLVLATMVFSVALELRVDDFRRVAQAPRLVLIGQIPQFILLPGATWLATLLLDLPPNVEAAMILVACCPGGSLSNVVTHHGRGNTALSVSISAVAALLALVLTPFNFTWMVSTNPATAGWLRQLDIDASDIWWSLLALLALPMALGLLCSHQAPALTARIRKPLGTFSLVALLLFIVAGLIKERQLLNAALLPQLLIVVLHNAGGLFLGWAAATAFRVAERDRRHHDRGRHAELGPGPGHHRRAIQRRPGHGDHRQPVGHVAHRQRHDTRHTVEKTRCSTRSLKAPPSSTAPARRRSPRTWPCRTAASPKWAASPPPRANASLPMAPGSHRASWTSTPTTTARPPGTRPSAPASTTA